MNRANGMKNKSAIFLPVVLFFLGLVLFLNFYLLYQNAKRNLISMKETEVLQAAKEFGDFYVESTYTVESVAYTLEGMLTEQLSFDEMREYLKKQSKIYNKLVDDDSTGLYAYIRGEYLDGGDWVPDADYVPQERPWYQTAKAAKGKVALVSPYLDSQTGAVMLSICKLLSDQKSVVSLDVSFDDTQVLVEQTALRSNWDSIMVIDESGFVVAHSEKTEVGKEYQKESGGLGNEIAGKLNSESGRSFEIRHDGKRYEVFFAPVWDKWHTVALVEAKTCFESLYKLYILFFVSILMVLGFIAASYLHIKRNQDHALEMNQQVRAIAGIFVSVHLIDIKQDTFSEVAVNADYVKVMLKSFQEHAQNSIRMVMDSMTDQRYKKSIYALIDFSTLEERLKDKRFISREFISTINHKCRAVFVPVEKDEDGSLRSVLFMVEIIDERGE